MPFDTHNVHPSRLLGYDDLYSETTEQGRYYTTPGGKRYPSITTVLAQSADDSWLTAWKERVGEHEAAKVSARARNRGTDLHACLEKYLANKDPECPDPIIQALFESYRVPLDELLSVVYGIELALYSDLCGVAGRADLIGIFNGRLSVIDYKTSRGEKSISDMKSYWMQTCFYAMAFYEITGILVDQLVILINSDYDPECKIYTQHTIDWVEPLFMAIQTYRNKNAALAHLRDTDRPAQVV